ncbi:MAG: hypothetical protein ACOYLS_10795 [Polymorphobacter sp.]
MALFAGLRRRVSKAAARLAQAELSDVSILVNQGRILAELNRARPAAPLAAHEFKVFSQWGDDGIIQRLIAEVPIADDCFIEFGVEDFSESNCRFLMVKDNWRGFVIDGSADNMARLRAFPWFWQHDLQACAGFIDADNIDDLLARSGFGPDIGLLSVDIDGMDYWVLSAISVVRPRIVVVEYNAVFGAERAISVPRDDSFVRGRAHSSNLYFGASLAAFAHWADGAGYALVGTNSTGLNAFFVREDVRPASLPGLSVAQAFTASRFRESRDAQGSLSYLTGDARLAVIAGLPVVNVVTGALESL